MTMLRRLITTAVIAASVTTMAAVSPRLLADLTGKWAMSVVTPDGNMPSVLTVTQKGDTVTGVVESELGTAPVTGTVRGDSLFFAFKVEMGGQQLSINGTGILKDKDSLDGSLDVSGLGLFPFTATRQP